VAFAVIALFGLAFSADSRADSFDLKNAHTVRDQGGRIISVKQPFQRIISLYGAHTENLFSLGLEAEIIGVSRHEAYPPAVVTKKVFSYRDDPEKFLAARPDLVLIRPMIARGYPQFVQRLEKSHITVVSLQPANVREMYVYWQILGVLTGKRARAEGIIVNFKKTAAELRSLTENLPLKKQVYFEAIHSKMKTFTPDSMAIFALETAGGVNVAGDAKQVRRTNIAAYGKERILAKADRIDVYLAQYGAMNRPTVEMIKKEPGFSAIRAVKNNEIYIIDEMIVSRPTMRLLTGIYEIGSKLYPEIFTAQIKNTVLVQPQRR
jgi:iron complex transport system substrate-binding protein